MNLQVNAANRFTQGKLPLILARFAQEPLYICGEE